jgi:hypothetical protein
VPAVRLNPRAVARVDRPVARIYTAGTIQKPTDFRPMADAGPKIDQPVGMVTGRADDEDSGNGMKPAAPRKSRRRLPLPLRIPFIIVGVLVTLW